MKTASRTPTVGCPIPPADRSSSRSWPSGSGISVSNLANISLRQRCAPLNLPLPTMFSLLQPTSQLLKVHQPQSLLMALPTGRNHPGLPASPARHLPCNPMEPFAVPLIVRSTHKNADRSAMAPCACCMLGGLAIAALVRCGNSVKKAPRPKNRDGSALYFGPSRLILAQLLHRHLCRPLPFYFHALLCSGGTGLVVIYADTGFTSSAGKP